MPRNRKTRVRLGDRDFVVDFSNNGNPLRIKERKAAERFGVKLFFNYPYWSAKHHSLGKGDTLVKRIIAAAQEKLNAPTP